MMTLIKNPLLHRYWIEFEPLQNGHQQGVWLIGWPRMAYGVTAYTYDDALWLLRKQVFRRESLPPIREVIEDIDISTLEAGHIRPHIGMPIWRGVWYPQGYQAQNSRSLTQLHRCD